MWVEVIVKLFFGPIAPSIAFLISSTSTQFQGKPFLWGMGQKYWGNGKILRFLTKIAACHCCGLTPVNERNISQVGVL